MYPNSHLTALKEATSVCYSGSCFSFTLEYTKRTRTPASPVPRLRQSVCGELVDCSLLKVKSLSKKARLCGNYLGKAHTMSPLKCTLTNHIFSSRLSKRTSCQVPLTPPPVRVFLGMPTLVSFAVGKFSPHASKKNPPWLLLIEFLVCLLSEFLKQGAP